MTISRDSPTAWQQDRWSNGAARGLRSAVSYDGGRTWIASAAAFTRCTGGTPANGGDYERASDPWAAIGPGGITWQISIVIGDALSATASAVLVARSPDGGLAWEPPITLIRDQGGPFNDKESMIADPTDGRYAYAIWDRLDVNLGPTVFTRTTDSGAYLGGAEDDPQPGHPPADDQQPGRRASRRRAGRVVHEARHVAAARRGADGDALDGQRRHLVAADRRRAGAVARRDRPGVRDPDT